jgi:hypothetical protein
MMPTWYGIMDYASGLPFPHVVKVTPIGEEGYHTVDQIKKIRGDK